jgi:hypothetical protein
VVVQSIERFWLSYLHVESSEFSLQNHGSHSEFHHCRGWSRGRGCFLVGEV